MKYINKIRNFYIPFDYPKFALVISIAAFAFAASSHNTPCLSAQSTCSVGSDNEFTGNISLKGGTAYKSTLDASGITADRTLTIPNNTGTLALTSDITPPSYTPDAPFLKADGTGAATSGTATADAPFVSVDASGQLDSSATLTADAPFLSADASGQIAAGGSLTASTPLKSSATGQIAASDLDITTDITPGSALQEIRVNSGGTALEYFTPPASSGDYSLLDSGAITNPTGSADEFLICWGSILDYTKSYKLVMWGGTGNNGNNSSYYPYLRPGKNDCSSGTRTEWDSGNNANYGSSFVGRILDAATSRSQDVTLCPLTQGTSTNSSSTYISNVGGQINFMTNAWKYSDTSGAFQSNNKGIRIFGDMLGHVTHTSEPDPYNGGIQRGDIYCEWFNDLDFVDITHFYGSLAVDSASQQQVYGKYWALYESAAQ